MRRTRGVLVLCAALVACSGEGARPSDAAIVKTDAGWDAADAALADSTGDDARVSSDAWEADAVAPDAEGAPDGDAEGLDAATLDAEVDAGAAPDAADDAGALDAGPRSCGSSPHGTVQMRDCYPEVDPANGVCTPVTQSRTCNDGTWSPDWPTCDWFACGTGSYLWAHRLGAGTGVSSGYDVAMDGANNAYVAAGYAQNFTGDPPDFAIEKVDPQGARVWFVDQGGTSSDEALGVALDAAGHVFATGYVGSNPADLGGGNLPGVSGGGRDLVVASYDGTSGAYRWALRFAQGGSETGNAVAADAAGNVTVVGVFSGASAAFGGPSFTRAGTSGSDLFLASFDVNGVYRWSIAFGGSGSDIADAIATDANGNLYVTGLVTGTVDLGGGPRTGSASGSVFLASYTSNGAHRWSLVFPGGSGLGAGVAVSGGRVLLGGHFAGDVDFGGGALTNPSGSDLFVAAFTTDLGTHQWSKNFSSTNSSAGYDIAADGAGNLYLTGQGYGHIDFGGGDAVYYDDIFVASFAPDGAYRWHKYFEHWNSLERSKGIAVGAEHLVLTGQLQSTQSFDGHGLPGWADDGFVLGLVR